jgi:hypothetical protein
LGTQESLKVTSVHLAFTGIEFAEPGQRTIEGFLLPSSSKKRLQDEGPCRSRRAEKGCRRPRQHISVLDVENHSSRRLKRIYQLKRITSLTQTTLLRPSWNMMIFTLLRTWRTRGSCIQLSLPLEYRPVGPAVLKGGSLHPSPMELKSSFASHECNGSELRIINKCIHYAFHLLII